eukprot:s780_g7.t1
MGQAVGSGWLPATVQPGKPTWPWEVGMPFDLQQVHNSLTISDQTAGSAQTFALHRVIGTSQLGSEGIGPAVCARSKNETGPNNRSLNLNPTCVFGVLQHTGDHCLPA